MFSRNSVFIIIYYIVLILVVFFIFNLCNPTRFNHNFSQNFLYFLMNRLMYFDIPLNDF